MADKIDIEKLKLISKNVRVKIIKMLSAAGSGHTGGSLSSVEILVTLFFYKIKRTVQNALDENRDRFVLSKGHGVPTVYAILSEIGLISDDELLTLRKLGSRLQGHPDRILLPYIEVSTGSLGQGMSIAQGMAIAGKLYKKDFRVYCMIGDGEMQEGEIWEAAMSGPKFKLDNLCVILDYNKLQIDGSIKDVMDIEPIADKMIAFNWNVLEIDGHNYNEIINALDSAEKVKHKPTFIIAHTVKGKGVSFIENKVDWHGIAPSKEQADMAIKEILSSN